MSVRKPRPVFLNLLLIRFPVTAILSIAHRITGVLLFLAMPFGIYLLGLSLQGPEGYARVAELFAYRGVRIASAVLLWAYVHHLLAGVRFLLLDIDVGIDIRQARATAWATNLIGFAAFLIALGGWW